jgi:hypothetical protein
VTKISQLSSIGDSLAIGDQFLIRDIDDTGSPNKSVTVSGITRALDVGTALAPAIAFASDKNTGIYSPGADQVAVATNGTGRLFVAADGKVGVGTAAPDVLLHLDLAPAGAGPAGVIGFGDISNFRVAEIEGLREGGAFAGSLIFRTQTGPGFGSAGLERARIDSSGNVGIGTSAPNGKLDVADGDVYITKNSGGDVPGVTSQSLYIKTQSGNLARLYSISSGSGGPSGFGGDLYIQTKSDNSALADRVVINRLGHVGIGTSSPEARLEVQAPSASRQYISSVLDFSNIHLDGATASGATSALTFTSGGGGGAAVAFSRGGSVDTEISFWTNSAVAMNAATERMRIDSSGRVGIGTTSPTSTLHVVGNQFVTGGNYFTDATSGYFFAGAGSFAGGIYGSSSGNIANIVAPQTITFNSGSGAAERARIDSSGNVGIGTTSILGKFSIQTLASTSSFSVRDATPVLGATGVLLENWDTPNAANTVPFSIRASTFSFGTNSGGTYVERMRIDSSGRVGIGTSSPGTILHTVNTSAGAATVGAFIQNSSLTAGTEVRLGFAPNTNTVADNRYSWIGAVNGTGSNDSSLTFATTPGGTGATERMRIDSSGRLLVGTSSAVAGTVDAASIVGSTLNQSTGLRTLSSGGTLDLNLLGTGIVGHLYVSSALTSNAAERTSTIFFIATRQGDNTVITSLNSANGSTGGRSFTITNPSANIFRFTDTSSSACSVSMSFVGGMTF